MRSVRYVANNALRSVDPTGCGDCAAGDMQCWENQWHWNNRWYNAHGYGWDGKGWSTQINPIFADRSIMDEVLSEAGVTLASGLSAWHFQRPTWIDAFAEQAARAVALFGRKLSGGMSALRTLLGNSGGQQTFVRLVENSPVWCRGNACAPPPPWGSGREVFLPVSWMQLSGANAYMGIVHELAHIVDWHSSLNGRGFSRSWSHPPITDYALNNGTRLNEMKEWDRFAEAAAVYVVGASYKAWADDFRIPDTDPNYTTQITDMQRLLEGWGW